MSVPVEICSFFIQSILNNCSMIPKCYYWVACQLILKMSCTYMEIPIMTFLGNHIQEPYMVPYRPYNFLYDLAMFAKIVICYSHIVSGMQTIAFFQHTDTAYKAVSTLGALHDL